ncbi:10579_t:CDS:2 [Rhizophagus irregularis]|nr:10579_t:CDS:2 [Rhizophagus irregularis]
MGRIDNFWLKSLLRLKHHNVAVNKKINAENVFLSCDLTCDGIQIGGSSNVIRGNKRSYENCKQSGNEETKNIRLRTPERQRRPSDNNCSDVRITREDDNNPFIGQTGENIRWSHAIDSVVINNASENDWTTQDLHRFLLESTN